MRGMGGERRRGGEEGEGREIEAGAGRGERERGRERGEGRGERGEGRGERGEGRGKREGGRRYLSTIPKLSMRGLEAGKVCAREG